MGYKGSSEIVEEPLIYVAIAHFNLLEHLLKCIKSVYDQGYAVNIVVYDDNSPQNVKEVLCQKFPDVILIEGDGNGWWAGGSNRAIEECLKRGADYILLLNPDTIMERNSLSYLLKTAAKKNNAIVASVVVKQDEPNKIWWAGTRLEYFPSWFPLIVVTRYLFKKGDVSLLPSEAYKTSEVHGRGVLIPAQIFKKIGLYDSKVFPHYGADIDFSWRCIKNNIDLYIEPKERVMLDYRNTGKKVGGGFLIKLKNYYQFLTKRKNGEFLRVSWNLIKRHMSLTQLIPTFLFWFLLNTIRFFREK